MSMKNRLLLLCTITFSTITYAQIEFEEKIIVDESFTTRNSDISCSADIDGDGDIDIISSGYDLNWYENIDGNGSFSERRTIATRFNASNIYADDFDNDGDMDIIVVNFDDIFLYENIDGVGNFNLKNTILRSGSSSIATEIHIVDIDGDNDKDIISFYVKYYTSSPFYRTNVVWYENNNGNFSTEHPINTIDKSTKISSIYAEDLDGDDDMDVILGFYDENKISFYKNSNNGNSFGSEIIVTTTAEGAKKVIANDIDNDGDIDIVAASENDNKIAYYKNNDGNGTFGDEETITTNALNVQSIYLADLDKDGYIDIISAGSKEQEGSAPSLNSKVSLYKNLGNLGTFEEEKIITTKAFGAKHVIAEDLNNDGFLDVISTSKDDNKVSWYNNIDGLTNFNNQIVISRIVREPQVVFGKDLDGDGDVDIISISKEDAKIAWYENKDGNGLFGNQQIIHENVIVNPGTPAAYPVDVDNDGDNDIIASIRFNDISTTKLVWFENIDGKGNFSTDHLILEKNENHSYFPYIISYDLDGDGDMDIVYQNADTRTIDWFENIDGKGNFGTSKRISNSGSNAFFTATDLDGDGDLDILTSYSDFKIQWFENTDGKGNFNIEHSFDANETGSIHSADMDNDGDIDVIAVSSNGYGNDSVAWYENIDGKGNFDNEHLISTVRIWGESIFPSDLDNDGDIDVLTASGHSSVGGTLAWYENINGTFSAQKIISETSNQSIGKFVYTTDIDGDSDLDIISAYSYWANDTFSKIAWYKNNSSSLGITDKSKNVDLSLYPNPTNGVFSIKSALPVYQIKVFTKLGQLVYESNNTYNMDISSLNKGIYFCEIFYDNKTIVTKKIVKK